MGQGLHTKMIQVSPWRNRDGAGSTHKDDRGESMGEQRWGRVFTHKDDTGESMEEQRWGRVYTQR